MYIYVYVRAFFFPDLREHVIYRYHTRAIQRESLDVNSLRHRAPRIMAESSGAVSMSARLVTQPRGIASERRRIEIELWR